MGRFLASAALLARFADAISVNENYTICNWSRLRAGVVRDALYLDGGQLWWQTAFADGTTPVVSSDGNAEGDMFRLNFSRPFDTRTSNLSALLESMPKAGGAGNNIAPNYVDGTILTNNDELYLYGGLPRLTDSASPQGADVVLGYEADQYGPYRQSWSPGFYQGSLSPGVTRYITNGASVSIPSENLAYYFSGMRSPTWGPIYYDDSSANQSANTLIEVDMSTMRNEKWTNSSLPDTIAPRANAELVWVPVSDQGVLIAIGGVTLPEEIWSVGLNSSQSSQSQSQSPSFMTSLPVYDVASKSWYLQNTTGEAPNQLTEFCSVMAAANDSSSFNIYIYGGYDGLNAQDEPSDDVWILSVPSFTWVKAYSGIASHGRSGHRCVTPYPNQMFIIGGMHLNQGNCVEGGFIQVFNLNTLQFQDKYDPLKWDEYQVPGVVTAVIGGDKKGGASKKATWSDNNLEGIFSTKYKRQIAQYYPYPSSTSSGGDPPSSGHSGHSGINKTVAIVIGIFAGLVAIILILVLLLLLRRRKILRSNSSVHSSTSNRSRVSHWINGTTPLPPKKTDSSSTPPEVQQVSGFATPSDDSSTLFAKQPTHHHEMADTDRPKPPFELATPYNSQDHPRNLGIVDYAYNSRHGHSNSSSSQADLQPSPAGSISLQEPALPRHFVDSDRREGSPALDNSPSWPLPNTQNTWRPHNGYNNSNNDGYGGNAVYYQDPDAPAVPSIPRQYRSLSPPMREHSDSSPSSGFDTSPSPYASLSQDEAHRESLYGAISPISPH